MTCTAPATPALAIIAAVDDALPVLSERARSQALGLVAIIEDDLGLPRSRPSRAERRAARTREGERNRYQEAG